MKKVTVVLVILVVALLLGWANWPGPALQSGVVADRVVVRKSQRRLLVFSHGQLVKSYSVSHGHRSLHISYPSSADRAHADALGVNPGGSIMVHGLSWPFFWVGRLHRYHDWTDGCVAVTNREMVELWRIAPAGTPIELQR